MLRGRQGVVGVAIYVALHLNIFYRKFEKQSYKVPRVCANKGKEVFYTSFRQTSTNVRL